MNYPVRLGLALFQVEEVRLRELELLAVITWTGGVRSQFGGPEVMAYTF